MTEVVLRICACGHSKECHTAGFENDTCDGDDKTCSCDNYEEVDAKMVEVFP